MYRMWFKKKHPSKFYSDRADCIDCREFKRKLFGNKSKYVSSRARLGELIFYTLYFMYGDICPICGKKMTNIFKTISEYIPLAATIDHRIPISKGGTDDISNLHLMCWDCNSNKKNDKILPEFIPACTIDPDSLEAKEMRFREKLARQKVYSFFKELLVNN